MKSNIVRGKTLAKFSPKPTIANANGELRKYITYDPSNPRCFKEVYFSRILPGKCKKWKINKIQTQNLTSALGRISVICIQLNGDSLVYEEFLIDDNRNFGVLEIPAGIIYGLFTDAEGALVVNSLEDPYSNSDVQTNTHEFDLFPTLL